jgi:flavin-dependent dehydrogenase
MTSLPIKQGHRWIAAGDSALKLDPLGSSGTAFAIDSGYRASQVVADALLGRKEAAESYGQWCANIDSEFRLQRLHQYVIEKQKRLAGFWTRRM